MNLLMNKKGMKGLFPYWKDMFPGQGLVEFAIILPVLLLLMLGIIEAGRLFFIYTSIGAAGREAARYGAGVGGNSSGTELYNDCTGIKAAAIRIGFFAGIKSSNIKIFHDTGPGSTPEEYCTAIKPTANFNLGDRILVDVDVSYSPIVPIVPIPQIPSLKSENAHTVLKAVPLIAVTPPSIPGGQTCDASNFKITNETAPLGLENKITITSSNGTTSSIKQIMVVWDPTGGPVLLTMIEPGGSEVTINSTGPYWLAPTNTSTWTIPGTSPSPSSIDFTLKFNKLLKNPVIIQLTLTNPNDCTIGQ